jgi:hypothetical protein
MLIQIKAPHFTAGIVTEYRQGDGDIVIVTAPIVHYMEGWSAAAVARYCVKKKWSLEVLK